MLFNRQKVCRPLLGGGLTHGANKAASTCPQEEGQAFVRDFCWGQGVDKTNETNKQKRLVVGLGEGMSEDSHRLDANACS